MGETTKVLKEKINAALRHADAHWAFHNALSKEARDYTDILIVQMKHPLAFRAGSQEQRFVELHRNKHQF